MARGGARPGAGRPARKSAPLPTRARARARVEAGNQRPWPADKVERWSIDRLIPYAKNARTHTDAQVAAIAASMKEWGWTNPVLADDAGGVIVGHAQDTRRPGSRHRRDPGHGRLGLDRGAEAGLCPGRQSAGDYRVGLGPGAAAARTRRVEAYRLRPYGSVDLKDVIAGGPPRLRGINGSGDVQSGSSLALPRVTPP
jgi:hypothetical protein